MFFFFSNSTIYPLKFVVSHYFLHWRPMQEAFKNNSKIGFTCTVTSVRLLLLCRRRKKWFACGAASTGRCSCSGNQELFYKLIFQIFVSQASFKFEKPHPKFLFSVQRFKKAAIAGKGNLWHDLVATAAGQRFSHTGQQLVSDSLTQVSSWSAILSLMSAVSQRFSHIGQQLVSNSLILVSDSLTQIGSWSAILSHRSAAGQQLVSDSLTQVSLWTVILSYKSAAGQWFSHTGQ